MSKTSEKASHFHQSRRYSRKAPIGSTPRLLAFLNVYLSRKTNRKKATVALLGCSERTAARLTCQKQPYQGRIKSRWAKIICDAVNQPYSAIFPDDLKENAGRTFDKCIQDWSKCETSAQANEVASICIQAICNWALTFYTMYNRYEVDNTSPRYPSPICIYLSPVLHLEHLGFPAPRIFLYVAPCDDGQKEVRAKGVMPRGHRSEEVVYDGLMTPAALRHIIEEAYKATRKYTKNFSTEAVKQAEAAVR